MGFVSHHKVYLSGRWSPRFSRVIYLGLTSGLCGSITTFSTWSLQCNKVSLLDPVTQSSVSTLGRIVAWGLCLWTGTAISLGSLRLGHHLALLSSLSNMRLQHPSQAHDSTPNSSGETYLIITYLCTTALVVIVPPIFNRPELTWVAVFGACGAFLRYILSLQNTRKEGFPVGTFAANVSSTWLLAGLTTISYTWNSRQDLTQTRALFTGLGYGFCGCLSTFSTLVNEFDSLPIRNAYNYGILTFLVAQIGVICLLDAPILTSQPKS